MRLEGKLSGIGIRTMAEKPSSDSNRMIPHLRNGRKVILHFYTISDLRRRRLDPMWLQPSVADVYLYHGGRITDLSPLSILFNMIYLTLHVQCSYRCTIGIKVIRIFLSYKPPSCCSTPASFGSCSLRSYLFPRARRLQLAML